VNEYHGLMFSEAIQRGYSLRRCLKFSLSQVHKILAQYKKCSEARHKGRIIEGTVIAAYV
jgi:hypothetical protein